MEQCGVYFHPSDENLSPGAQGRKTPLDRIGSALHQLENRYRADVLITWQRGFGIGEMGLTGRAGWRSAEGGFCG